MSRLFKLLCVLPVALLCLSLSFFIRSKDKEFKEALENPLRKLESYNFDPDSSLIERVKTTPDFVLNAWAEFDQKDDYTSYTPNREELHMIGKCLDGLPPLHGAVLKERLVGIYFINNFIGSGMADWLFDEEGDLYCYMGFNTAILRLTFSELVTQKEGSLFIKDDPDLSVKIDCGDELPGFMYILLHESTHVSDYVKNITPYTEKWMTVAQSDPPDQTPFTMSVWRSYRRPVRKYNFSYRKHITFYGLSGGPRINISDAVSLYKRLGGTPFASVHGSTNWAEDLAEYVTFYHLTQKSKHHYVISVENNAESIFTYEPMKNQEVIKRMPLMDQFYK